MPNFRPAFKWFSPWTAAAGQPPFPAPPLTSTGALINIGVMFFLNWQYALVGISALTLLFVFLLVRAPARGWGEARCV